MVRKLTIKEEFLNLDNWVDPMELVRGLDDNDWDYHASDLYLRKTPETTKLISKLSPDQRAVVTTFIDQIDHVPWYEIPFGYHQ